MLLCSNSPVFGLNKCSKYLWPEKEEHKGRMGMTVMSRLQPIGVVSCSDIVKCRHHPLPLHWHECRILSLGLGGDPWNWRLLGCFSIPAPGIRWILRGCGILRGSSHYRESHGSCFSPKVQVRQKKICSCHKKCPKTLKKATVNMTRFCEFAEHWNTNYNKLKKKNNQPPPNK